MKIDIEGADLLCIEALTDFEDRSQRVSIESTKTSWPDMKREFALLRSLGYSRFKVVDQTEVTISTAPRRHARGPTPTITSRRDRAASSARKRQVNG